MASRSPRSTSWQQLAALRRRGQKPAMPVFISDHYCNLDDTGVLSLSPPAGEGDEAFLYGLAVVALLTQNETNIAAAHRIASARPKSFTVCWRGGEVQRVLP